MQKKLLATMDALGVKNETLSKTLNHHYGSEDKHAKIIQIHQEIVQKKIRE